MNKAELLIRLIETSNINTVFYIVEEITKIEINKLKKDFNAFTKNINRIKNGKDLLKVQNAWNIWVNYFEDFVYKKFLGVQRKHSLKDSWWVGEAKTKSWEIIINKSHFFVPPIESYGRDIIIALELKGYFRYDGKSKYHSDWEELFELWSKVKKKQYNKLSRIGRDAFKAINKVLEIEGGKAVDKYQKEISTYKGAGIEIISSEGGENDQDAGRTKSFVKSQVDNIKKAYTVLNKKGLGKVYNGVKFIIDRDNPSGLSKGAEYDIGTDSVSLYMWSEGLHTVIHELGHRWWYKFMSKKQIKGWEEFYYRSKVFLSGEESDDIKQAFWKGFDQAKDGDNIWNFVHDNLKIELSKLKFKAAVDADMNRDKIFSNDVIREKANNEKESKRLSKIDLDTFFEVTKGGILINPITTYGATKATEAYPEAFAQYILNKDMNPFVKQVFKLITVNR